MTFYSCTLEIAKFILSVALVGCAFYVICFIGAVL